MPPKGLLLSLILGFSAVSGRHLQAELEDIKAALEASICDLPEHQEEAVIERVLFNSQTFIKTFHIKDGSKRNFYLKLLRIGAQSSRDRDARILEIAELWHREFPRADAQSLMIATFNAEDFILFAESVQTFARCRELEEERLSAELYGVVFEESYIKGQKEEQKRMVRRRLAKVLRS